MKIGLIHWQMVVGQKPLKLVQISGSRESLPYFSENPNKNKSAFAEFYFYFPLLLHYFVKNKIKMTFEMKKQNKHTHTKQSAKCYYVLNHFYIARRTKSSSFIHSFIHSFMLGQFFIHSLMVGQIFNNMYNIHA